MDKEGIIKEIKKCISFVSAINIEKLEIEKSLINDYQIGYFDMDEIIISLEDKFDVELAVEGYEKLNTINNIADIIKEKL